MARYRGRLSSFRVLIYVVAFAAVLAGATSALNTLSSFASVVAWGTRAEEKIAAQSAALIAAELQRQKDHAERIRQFEATEERLRGDLKLLHNELRVLNNQYQSLAVSVEALSREKKERNDG